MSREKRQNTLGLILIAVLILLLVLARFWKAMHWNVH